MMSRGYTVKSYAQTVAARRSIYSITDNLSMTDDELASLVATALEATPSPFNCQAARVAVLLGRQHHEFWQIVSNCLREILDDDAFWAADERIDGFSAGYGTLLFFEDEDAVAAVAEAHPGAASRGFPSWADQESAIAQFNVWNMLEEVGVGASIQHYNPMVDEKVRERFGLPQSWRLVAQMPFGEFDALPADKDVVPGAQRMRVFR